MRVRYEFGSRHTGHIENIAKQRKKYPDIVANLIQISDIILEVLDARFPQETRNLEIEEEILNMGKKIIYVLNKADMVEDLAKKKEQLKEMKLYPYVLVSCRSRVGSNELREKIKIEAKRVELPHGEMKRVQVGIIGYPNTGKSSLINFLTGRSAAKVGAEAGFTKGLQKVKLTQDILVLDTPGVIPQKEYSASDKLAASKHAKVNARDYSKVRSPDFVVAKLMEEYPEQIEKFYGVDVHGNSDELIQIIGHRRNMLKKGGVIDEDKAARVILKDWQEGKIKT
ncbi:GTPase Der [uncultured archaeon]|nr:GTPase Der [uncultured archaeon]